MGLDITRLIACSLGGAGLSWRFWAQCLALPHPTGLCVVWVRYHQRLYLSCAPRRVRYQRLLWGVSSDARCV